MRIMTITELLEHYKAGDAAKFISVSTTGEGKTLLHVPFVGEVVKVSEEDHTLVHFISTPRIDYVRDIMNPFGANLAALEKNGGVFWNHAWDMPGQASLPIGKNVGLEARKDGILARTQYAVDVTKDDFAGDVYRLTKGGFIKSWSIGFFPSGAERVKLSDAMNRIGEAFEVPNASAFNPESEVILHSTWDLFEYSAVGVPMNQDAVNVSGLKRALAAGEIKSALGLEHFGKLAGGREQLNVNLEDDQVPVVGSVDAGGQPAAEGETGEGKLDQALGLLRTLVGEVAELRVQVEGFRTSGEKSLELVVEKSEQALVLLTDAIDLQEKERSNQPATAAGGAPEAKGHQQVKLSELIERAISKSAPPTQARIHNQ